MLVEPTLHLLLVEILKALQVRTVSHHHHALHYLFFVLSNEFQPQEKQHSKMIENVWLCTFHQLHIVLGELERCSFKPHIARATRNHETEIYMYDMARSIYQNIVVVSVLYLEKILDQRVSSQALDEVCCCLFPIISEDLLINSS